MISMEKTWWFKPVDLDSCSYTSTPQFLSFLTNPHDRLSLCRPGRPPLGGRPLGAPPEFWPADHVNGGRSWLTMGWSRVSYNFSDIPILASSHVREGHDQTSEHFCPLAMLAGNSQRCYTCSHEERKSTKVINMTEETSITSILFTPLPFLRTWWPPLAPSAKRCSISRGTRLWSPKFAMFFSVNLVCSGVANWFIIAKWSQLGIWTLDKSYTCSSEIKEIGLSGEGSGPNWTWCAKI